MRARTRPLTTGETAPDSATPVVSAARVSGRFGERRHLFLRDLRRTLGIASPAHAFGMRDDSPDAAIRSNLMSRGGQTGSVHSNGSATFAWRIAGGTSMGATSISSITFTPNARSAVTLTVSNAKGCAIVRSARTGTHRRAISTSARGVATAATSVQLLRSAIRSSLGKGPRSTELRAALDAARTACGLSTLNHTDTTLTVQSTGIKAAHITDLRNGVK